MNYSNMIEEKRLKQGFIVATLISTIAGTFTTGINLYDRIADKRKQSKLDKGQDKRIKELEKRVNGNAPPEGNQRGVASDDKLRQSLEHGGNKVQREYDQHYAQLGSRFAEGDLTAQLQLQSQVITLQGTVIKVLEEALFSGNPPDISKLYNASEFAREGSIRVLRDQYRRLLQAPPPGRIRPAGPVRRISSTPAMRDGSTNSSSDWGDHGPPRRALTFNDDGPLFCRCAVEFQQSNKQVDEVLIKRDSSYACPVCGATFGSAVGSRQWLWRIEKEVTLPTSTSHASDSDDRVEVTEIRSYLVGSGFLFKCHREGSGYACYLCYCHRKSDTLCKGAESLIGHVTKKHQAAEYAGDPDIKDVTHQPH